MIIPFLAVILYDNLQRVSSHIGVDLRIIGYRNSSMRPCKLCKLLCFAPVNPISYINENLIRQLSVLEPFGKGNAKPVFAQKNLRVLKIGIYGKTQNTVKLQLMDESGTVMDGVYWGEAKEFAEFARSHGTFSVTYYPKINSYMGRDSLPYSRS